MGRVYREGSTDVVFFPCCISFLLFMGEFMRRIYTIGFPFYIYLLRAVFLLNSANHPHQPPRWTAIFRIWQAGHTVFAQMKSDSFFLCSPSGSMLLTCDARLVRQVLGRAHDFHAPVEVLSLYNLYGPTLAASEGEQWRLYRRISTPFFNTRTHARVWRESLAKAERVSEQWDRGGSSGGGSGAKGTRVSDVKGEVMSKLNLRVIAKIFYGRELEYARDDATRDVAPAGHALTFSEAINAVLSNLATLFGLPKWLLGALRAWKRKIGECGLFFLLIRWG